MEKRFLVEDDIVVGAIKGDMDVGVPVPPEFENADRDFLRYVEGKIIDVSDHTTWYVDDNGDKHYTPGKGRQRVTGVKVRGALRKIGGKWEADKHENMLVAYLAERRWEAEIGGVVVDGMAVSTSRDSQASLTMLYVASRDSRKQYKYRTAERKTEKVTAAKIKQMFDAVHNHVQACFDVEVATAVKIESGEITTLDQIDKVGWPTGNAVRAPVYHDYHDQAEAVRHLDKKKAR